MSGYLNKNSRRGDVKGGVYLTPLKSKGKKRVLRSPVKDGEAA